MLTLRNQSYTDLAIQVYGNADARVALAVSHGLATQTAGGAVDFGHPLVDGMGVSAARDGALIDRAVIKEVPDQLATLGGGPPGDFDGADFDGADFVT